MVYVLLGTLLALNLAFVSYKTAKVMVYAGALVKESSKTWKETATKLLIQNLLCAAQHVDALKTGLSKVKNRLLVNAGVYDAVDAVYAIDAAGFRVAELSGLEGNVNKLCKIVLEEKGLGDSFAIEVCGFDENGAELRKIIMPDEILFFPIFHNIQMFEVNQCIIATLVCKDRDEHIDVTGLCVPWLRVSNIEHALVGIYRSLLDDAAVMSFTEDKKECELAVFWDDFSLATYAFKSS